MTLTIAQSALLFTVFFLLCVFSKWLGKKEAKLEMMQEKIKKVVLPKILKDLEETKPVLKTVEIDEETRELFLKLNARSAKLDNSQKKLREDAKKMWKKVAKKYDLSNDNLMEANDEYTEITVYDVKNTQ